jgi:hypothetical protein
MASIQLENLSSFGRLAVQLDSEFSELTRISGQLQRLEIDSDSGLDRAVKLLGQFAEHGKNIAEGIQDFSKFLQEVRDQSEAATKVVAERAEVIRQRKEHQNQIQDKLNQITQSLKEANASLSGFRKEGKTEFSAEEKVQIKAQLERFGGEMKKFLVDAHSVKEEASQSNFKGIEREAQALLEALRSSSRKIDKVISEP